MNEVEEMFGFDPNDPAGAIKREYEMQERIKQAHLAPPSNTHGLEQPGDDAPQDGGRASNANSARSAR